MSTPIHRVLWIYLCVSTISLGLTLPTLPGCGWIQELDEQGGESGTFFSSPLRRAIQRGLAPDGNIVKELEAIRDKRIFVQRDAEAIINAVAVLTPQRLTQRFPPKYDNRSALFTLAALFDNSNSKNSPASRTFQEKGVPVLLKAYDAVLALKQPEDEGDLLFVLKISAKLGSQESVSHIVEATQRPLAPNSFLWSSIFSELTAKNPITEVVFRSLPTPRTDERISEDLLVAANKLMLTEQIDHHPFDTPTGHQLLEKWLIAANTNSIDDQDESSLPLEATIALRYIDSAEQARLLKIALQNPSKKIQLEAAGIATQTKLSIGVETLANLCQDVHYSFRAKSYLEQIEKREAIPAAASEPSFIAKAKFSNWLQQFGNLNSLPDELIVVDHREIPWPPTGDKKEAWLIQYVVKDPTGLSADDTHIGIVGPTTGCLVDDKTIQRPIEDIYALHACIEMQNNSLIGNARFADLLDPADWLPQWKGKPLSDVQIISAVTASDKLDLRNLKLVVASAVLEDNEGWVVFDGPRTTWYPKSEQPAGDQYANAELVLKIHLGRQLLNLPITANDRKEHLKKEPQPPGPEAIISNFDKLLEDATTNPSRVKNLFRLVGPIESYFDTYVDAVVTTKNLNKDEVTIAVYERLLAVADKATNPADQDDIYEPYSVIGTQFNNYVDILLKRNRQADAIQLILRLEPVWKSHSDYILLGATAFKAGDHPLAEKILSHFLENIDLSFGSEAAVILAEIWKARGDTSRGQKLLVETLNQIKSSIAETANDNRDRPMYFRQYRSTYDHFLQLYPDGEELLKSANLSADPT